MGIARIGFPSCEEDIPCEWYESAWSAFTRWQSLIRSAPMPYHMPCFTPTKPRTGIRCPVMSHLINARSYSPHSSRDSIVEQHPMLQVIR